jgi:hypothetical protein
MFITVTLFTNSALEGKLEIDGLTMGIASAKSGDEALYPKSGSYKLIRVVYLNKHDDQALFNCYGTHVIFFEAVGGTAALSSPENPKRILAVHGGLTDEHDSLLPTEGSIRLRNDELETLVKMLRNDIHIPLILKLEEPGLLKKLAGKKVSQVVPTLPRPAPRSLGSHSSVASHYERIPYWMYLNDLFDSATDIFVTHEREEDVLVPSGAVDIEHSISDPVIHNPYPLESSLRGEPFQSPVKVFPQGNLDGVKLEAEPVVLGDDTAY